MTTGSIQKKTLISWLVCLNITLPILLNLIQLQKSDVSSVTCFEDISRENYESKETIVNLFHWLLVSRRFTLLKCDKEEVSEA